MDLTTWLLRRTPPRPLVVTVPGGTEARLAAERAARERGWRMAFSPAAANILVVAGIPDGAIRSYIDQTWSLIPAPRVRIDVRSPVVHSELDAAVVALHDPDRQREQAALPEPAPEESDQHAEHGSEHGDHSAHGDHAGHEGHDMGGMGMPGGVPMAERAEDRDGLALDQLHVPLGPILPDWPAGLVIDTTMQGDVLSEARVHTVGVGESRGDALWTRPWRRLASGAELTAGNAARWEMARRLDAGATLLTLAGWADAASGARLLRDDALHGEPAEPAAKAVRSWARRVRRARTLRWLLSGVGTVPKTSGVPTQLAGDALSRLYRWIDTTCELSERLRDDSMLSQGDGDAQLSDRVHETQWTLDTLPALLEGSELATARLTVASLDLDLDLLPVQHRVSHG
jgi:hypothetical protein